MASQSNNETYESIERPYGAFLERDTESVLTAGEEAAVGFDGAGTTSAAGGGSVSETDIKSENNLDDLTIDTFIRSKNWKPKTMGFYINGETGYAEFSNIYISGGITVITGGTIGGWTISPTELSSGNVKLQSTAERILLGSATAPLTGVGIFIGKDGSDYELRAGDPAGAYMHWNGSSLALKGGNITEVGTGTDIALLEYTHNLVFSATDADTVAWASGTITMSNGQTYTITGADTGNMAARTFIYLDTGVSSTLLQTTTTASTAMGRNKILIAVAQNGSGQPTWQVYGGIGGLKLKSLDTNIANNEWAFSGTWSITDADTIAWGAGTLTTSDGTAYSITGSNTGNMAAKTYIYFDLGTSSTAFQTTTTASTAVGDGKILIAIAQNGTGEATFIVVNDKSLNIDAANIVAGSITANEIAAGAITATKISVSQLSAITADMGAITAGTIVLPSGGYIRSGQTAYDTGTGFYIGNDSGTPKFSIGNSAGDKLTWNGTTLGITGDITASAIDGSTITGGEVRTASSGDRIVLTADYLGSGDPAFAFYDGAQVVGRLEPLLGVTGNGFRLFANDNSEVDQAELGIICIGDGTGPSSIELWPHSSTADGMELNYDLGGGASTVSFRTCDLATDFDPDTDETRDLGNTSQKYDNIWCATIHRTSESSPSDVRLKNNIVNVDYGLAEIMQLRPVHFMWKNNQKPGYGFIAQEVQTVMPDLVSEIIEKVETRVETGDPYTVNIVSNGRRVTEQRRKKETIVEYKKVLPEGALETDPGLLQIEMSALVPVLVKAIQELSERVKTLEGKK